MNINTLEANSTLINVGGALNANLLSIFGITVINANNYNVTKVTGSAITITVINDMKFSEIFANRNVTINCDDKLVVESGDKISANYGKLDIRVKNSVLVESGAVIKLQTIFNITVNGINDQSFVNVLGTVNITGSQKDKAYMLITPLMYKWKHN